MAKIEVDKQLEDIKKVASLNEVKSGNAQIILQTSNEGCKKFDIEILN